MDVGVVETEFAKMGAELAACAAKNLASTVANKFKAIRGKQDLKDVCNSYEEIINELLSDRAQIIAIAQAYEAELKRYTLTDEDIKNLQLTATAAIDALSVFTPNMDRSGLDGLKALISADTLKAMQLLGFDYKKAIGDPLTEVCAQAIRNYLGASSKRDTKTANGQKSNTGRPR